MGKASGDSRDEELVGIEPVEVSITVAPMVREDFLMTKSAITPEAVQEVVKSLGIEPTDLTDADLEKVHAAVVKAMPPQLAAALQGGGGDAPPAKKKPVDPNEPDEDELCKSILDSSPEVKKAMQAAAGLLKTHKSALPAPLTAVLKALAKAQKDNPDAFKDADVSKSDIEVFKSAFPGVIEEITAPLTRQLAEATKTVQEMVDSRDLSDMHELAKSMPLQGEPDAVAKRLLDMKKAMPTALWDEFVADQKAIFAQVSKSESFRQVSGRGMDGSATEKMQQLAKDIVQKSSGQTSIDDALALVAQDRPDLYSEYLNEQRNAAARPLASSRS